MSRVSSSTTLDRGAIDLDLPELDEAVQQIAIGENVAVFHGYAAGGIEGITERTSHAPITHGDDMSKYPDRSGPSGGRPASVGHRRTFRHGHLPEDLYDDRRIHRTRRTSALRPPPPDSGGPAGLGTGRRRSGRAEPARRRLRSRLGQDISIGYLDHNADAVRLYLEESFSFRVIEPDAAVAVLLEA